MSELTERIRRELAAATSGPWWHEAQTDNVGALHRIGTDTKPRITDLIGLHLLVGDAALIVTLRNHADVLVEIVAEAELFFDSMVSADERGQALMRMRDAVCALREVNDEA